MSDCIDCWGITVYLTVLIIIEWLRVESYVKSNGNSITSTAMKNATETYISYLRNSYMNAKRS